MDHMNNISETQNVKVGKPVILPSSFIGSPRAMQQNYQDAMALVRKFGKPDYFITMACNPKWKEINENLEAWQKPEYRPDLVARVFKLKFKELQKDLFERNIFGKHIAHIYVIEFQKRGLPHAHLLMWVDADYKPKTADDIDAIISAEIPDESNQDLFNIVTRHMIHGPCGICLVDGHCSKQFPKEFTNETNPNVDGYPKYKRPKGNNHLIKGRQINNSWVVPYNRYLMMKYNSHINVEVCA